MDNTTNANDNLVKAEERFRDYHKRIREIRYALLEDIINEFKARDFEYNETYTLVNSGYDFKLKKSDSIENKVFYRMNDGTMSVGATMNNPFVPLCSASLVQLNMILLCLAQHTLLVKKFL